MKIIIYCIAALAGFAGVAATAVAEPQTDSNRTPASAQWVATEQVLSKIIPGWQGEFKISPDGRHVAYMAGVDVFKPEEQYVGSDGWMKHAIVLDGKVGKHYNYVSEYSFSPDSNRIAYIGTTDEWRVVVVDGRETEHYGPHEISARYDTGLQFSPDSQHVAYFANNSSTAGPSFIVVDGKKGKEYATINKIFFSPDSKRIAYLVEDNRLVKDPHFPQGRFLVIDGQQGKVYGWIQNQTSIFSPDSQRYAYFARDEKFGKAFVVVDGREEGRQFSGVNDTNALRFSPDSKHILYVVYEKDGLSVVVDGKKGKGYAGWGIFEPVFSPDSQRMAFIVKTSGDGEVFVVADGRESRHYSGKSVWVHYVTFSPDSKHIAYVVTADQNLFVVKDDVEGKHYQSVNWIMFSPDGSRLAYIAYNGSKYIVVVDGVEGQQYDGAGALVFSPDGKTLAFEAYDKKAKKWRVVINGENGKLYDSILIGDYKNPEGSLRFDANDSFRYLAMDKGHIYMVEEKLSAPATK
jgi:WD40 repeat protein